MRAPARLAMTALLSLSVLAFSAAPAAVAAGNAQTAGTAAAANPAQSTAVDAPGALTSQVTGTFTDAGGEQGVLTGTFTPRRFTTTGGTTEANGVLTGTLTDSNGAVLGTVSQPMTAAVSDIAAVGCQILDLVLGPLDLDLLGLRVHLDRVHLNITAVPGPGNLLGNLLCAIAGLLDGGNLGGLGALLNQILALLGLLR